MVTTFLILERTAMDFDIQRYLESKSCVVKPAGSANIHTSCFFCDEPAGKRGRLYIAVNSDPPGLFDCKLCGKRGALNTIRKHFGDSILKEGDEGYYDATKSIIIREAVEFYKTNLFKQESQKALDYLHSRGLTDETINKHRLGYASGGLKEHLLAKKFTEDQLHKAAIIGGKGGDILTNHIVIPYFVAGNAITFRGRALSPDAPTKYVTLKGHKAYLYNSDTVWEKKNELAITEGEFDAIMLQQLGIPAVGVPGASSWQDNWDTYVEPAMVSRLYVCMDNDDVGKKSASKLAARFNGRAKVIELPILNGDINEWILKGGTLEQFRELTKKSSGGLLVSVREAYDRWKEIEGNGSLVGLKFGYINLDEAIKPGLLPGQVVVTLAKTNSGKTLGMLNMFHRMKMEQPTRKFLFVSLEQTRNEWFERAHRIHKFYQPAVRIEDTISFWEENFMIIDKNQIKEEELMNCIDQYEYEMGTKPDLVGIDYLGYWARPFKGAAYDRITSAIMSAKAIAKEKELVIYLPQQVSRATDAGGEPELDSARDGGTVEETADFLIAFWALDQRKDVERSERTGQVGMKLLKSRHGGVGTRMNAIFTPKTLAIIPENDPLAYKAVDEVRLARVGDDLDTVVYRNLTGWNGVIVTSEVREEIAKLKEEGYM